MTGTSCKQYRELCSWIAKALGIRLLDFHIPSYTFCDFHRSILEGKVPLAGCIISSNTHFHHNLLTSLSQGPEVFTDFRIYLIGILPVICVGFLDWPPIATRRLSTCKPSIYDIGICPANNDYGDFVCALWLGNYQLQWRASTLDATGGAGAEVATLANEERRDDSPC